jgi:ATP-dependent Clp protease ATP-binding subunit ClpA
LPDRFQKFTERARRALSFSQEEAQRFNHNYIGTEHLLLGLTREREGVAAIVLARMGVELERARAAVEHIIGRGDRMVMGDIGLTPRAKKVIELAVDEARLLEHPFVGTEHILLGLVREGEGIAAGALVRLGAQLDQVRSQVLVTLAGDVPSERVVGPASIVASPRQAAAGEQWIAERAEQAARLREQLDEVARAALERAESEAGRRGHPEVGNDHLLLALLGDADSVTAAALREVGMNIPGARSRVAALLGPDGPALAAPPELDPQVRATVRNAIGLASLNARPAGAPYLLLSLLDRDVVARWLLTRLGAPPEPLRAALLRLLDVPEGS